MFAQPAQDARTFVDPVFDPAYNDDAELRLSQFDESKWSDVLLDRAMTGIRRHPSYVAANSWRNVQHLIKRFPTSNDSPELLDGRNLDFRHATLPFFYVVSCCGAAGCWLYRRDRRILLLGVLALQFALLCILILAPPRLRAPVDLVLCIGAGLAIDRALGRLASLKETPGLASSAAADVRA